MTKASKMNSMGQIVMTLSILILWSCGNPQNGKKEIEKEEFSKVEIFTKTYSVKLDGEKVVKDTVNMIQSMIVDHNGKEITNKYYNLDGTSSWADDYTYDEQGRKIGSKYFENGKQTAYYEYDLDSLGRRIAYEAKDVKTDTLLYDGASQYLENGKIRRDGFLTKAGEFKYNFEYQFDENGRELGYIYIDRRSGDKYPSVYRYTKFKNTNEWMEREIVENDAITSIEVREFKEIK